MDNIQIIISVVKSLHGNEPFTFSSPVQIDVMPHSVPTNIWGIWIAPNDNVYLMDNYERWFQLASPDRNYNLVVTALEQHLNTMLANVK